MLLLALALLVGRLVFVNKISPGVEIPPGADVRLDVVVVAQALALVVGRLVFLDMIPPGVEIPSGTDVGLNIPALNLLILLFHGAPPVRS